MIGAKPFTEQYVLAALIEQRLEAHGLSAQGRDGLGSGVIFNALVAGDIDAYVDYSGTIWANQMHRSDVKPRAEVLAEVSRWLETTHGIRLLGPLGFENAYALAMPRARAEKLGIRSIADLAAHASELSIAGDYEFFERPEWKAIRDAYGLHFRKQRTMQSDFMYQAAAAGDVDVVSAYTSDGRIAQFDLTVLDDPKHAIPPYDAVLLLSPKRANDDAADRRAQAISRSDSGRADARSQLARLEWRHVAGRCGELAVAENRKQVAASRDLPCPHCPARCRRWIILRRVFSSYRADISRIDAGDGTLPGGVIVAIGVSVLDPGAFGGTQFFLLRRHRVLHRLLIDDGQLLVPMRVLRHQAIDHLRRRAGAFASDCPGRRPMQMRPPRGGRPPQLS